MIRFQNEKEVAANIAQAMRSGNETDMTAAWQKFHESVAEQVIADFEAVQASNDSAILAQRGYRQLTGAETKFYQKLIGALKSADPKQAFVTVITDEKQDGVMPETILADVYKNLTEEHPLLAKVNFQYVGYTTKWILHDHNVQTAVWGQITDAITKEITSGFRVVDVDQNKLSAYASVERGMLDLGPTFLDGYVRRVLAEALALGLEYGIINGTGVKEPIGLIRDIHEGASFSTSTGYNAKTKEKVTSFDPKSYGTLVAKLAKTERGQARKINGPLCMLCTPSDYFTKIMPATTVLGTNGVYAHDLFPVPTEVVQTSQLTDGEAVLFIPDEYNVFAGANRNGVLEYSDEFKFLDDVRTFKIKTYATGSAYDNTSALYLDISALEPAYINVKATGDITTTVDGTVTTQSTPAA